MGKESKGKPGPTSYNDVAGKDKFLLKRTLGTYKSSNAKYTYQESDLHFRKKDPGPNKYTPKYEFLKPATPFYAKMETATGRYDAEKKQKKGDKTIGPTTYKWETSLPASSQAPRGATNILISGMGTSAGAKETLKHVDKLKVKSNRVFDTIQKNGRKTPGVGHYKPEKADGRTASLPTSLKARRH